MAYEKWQDVVPQAGKQKQCMQMIQNKEVDFLLMGGARAGGKTEILSMIPLMFCNDPQYRGIFFRRSYEEIMGANGLWQKAENMYPLFKAGANKTSKTWKFPSGALQEYSHMYNTGDEQSHRGRGYSMVGFDEIDQFTPDMVRMLMTCLRSEADMDSFLVGTLNPNVDSWCLPLVEYYLLKDGSPDQDKCGEIRWYVMHNNEMLFGPSEDWFKEHHPDKVYVHMPNQDEPVYVRPKRFSYVFFNVFDNPLFLKVNPAYLSELQNLPDHERASQLWGNWYSREKGVSVFRSDWLKKTDFVPKDVHCVRAWDKAYSDNISKYPDYTASVKMYKDSVGRYYICGEYHEDLIDDFKKGEDIIYGRFRKLAGQRNEWMIEQANFDGDDCTIVIPSESGAGKGEEQEMTKMFIEHGFKVRGAKVGNAKGAKMKRFTTFTSACQNGVVYILEDSFSNKATLRKFLNELENFDGERSTATKKDDWVDAVSDCFLTLCSQKVHRIYSMPSIGASSRTALADHKERIK